MNARVVSISALAASQQIFMQWICVHFLNLANNPLLAVNVLFPLIFCWISSKRLTAFPATARWVRGIHFWFKSSTHSVSNFSIFSMLKFLVYLIFDVRNFVVFCADCFIFLVFAIIVDTVVSAKLRQLQILSRYSPASSFVITKVLVSKVSLPCSFCSFLQKRIICLLDGRRG